MKKLTRSAILYVTALALLTLGCSIAVAGEVMSRIFPLGFLPNLARGPHSTLDYLSYMLPLWAALCLAVFLSRRQLVQLVRVLRD
ncbi:MAG: hypothetical protein WCG97_01255 [bacterium]